MKAHPKQVYDLGTRQFAVGCGCLVVGGIAAFVLGAAMIGLAIRIIQAVAGA